MTEPHAAALVRAPQDNVSDDSYLLLSWNVADGHRVEQGEVLGEFETSKSVFELPAEVAGFFYALAEVDQQVAVNELVAVISPQGLTSSELQEIASTASSDTSDEMESTPVAGTSPRGSENARAQTHQAAADPSPGDGNQEVGVRFSRAAEEFVIAHAVDRSLVAGPGLVRLADVQRIVSERGTLGAAGAGTANVSISGSSVVIIGGGGHARMLLDLLEELRSFRVVGILDGGMPLGSNVGRYSVMGPDTEEELEKLHSQGVRLAVNGVGGVTNRKARPAVWDKLKMAGFGLPNLVHPKAAVDASARLSEGAQVLAGAYVGAGAIIGDDCIVNNGAVVSHDCVIDEHTHLTPGAVLAGNVKVGSNSLVGMNSSVYLGVSIGSNAIVANGVSVFADVPDGAVVRRD